MKCRSRQVSGLFNTYLVVYFNTQPFGQCLSVLYILNRKSQYKFEYVWLLSRILMIRGHVVGTGEHSLVFGCTVIVILNCLNDAGRINSPSVVRSRQPFWVKLPSDTPTETRWYPKTFGKNIFVFNCHCSCQWHITVTGQDIMGHSDDQFPVGIGTVISWTT